ncbi:bifunctional 5,10-methylenetetrahydrofolate dehydrogenase/5,10-methenyltetrahydrofolate cyclohydrolase [Vagococcus xieshaowenii]|uniref:Bifunctional protein FolD n=1 Tax=Vagococcus xieshaowenii TaxID=2562451 RepID=A0AAJ5EGK5_9ENTE|nr:bifunctional 5,10-methylenetetrahydrofolate dehydrogenase/5,10-methenyltetrahydrofolate cyclohydrolase [Vagococcus xieshaowenii]QCA28783.1 bifunctional 5,10-methylenetetrahydrofolate dehydrogenase/5,10-methenyltetrahydrofolate cyclohydrolase [Vagococcus xieshaowenii]TFZ43016.1 bifunctional 5,10-methylenetetrahydrofolate dehydrogenase/5,10-methenyltetrahydrofolate cyclohydrolase [Vagococcus xieshaowenii]
MVNIVKGIDIVREKKEHLTAEINELTVKPNLTIIRVGEDADQLYYEQACHRILGNIGFDVNSVVLPSTVEQTVFDKAFEQVNDDKDVHGILLLKPLPEHLSDEYASRVIHEAKDVDCFGQTNMLKIYQGDFSGYLPCTAQACLEIIDYLELDLKGMRTVVAGYSMVVGKPLALALMARGATLKICRSTTKDLAKECRDQELIISAMGQAQMIQENYVNEEAVVIDVGINPTEDGKIVGDVAFESVHEQVKAITPVPGGVGTVTNFVLAKHVMKAYKILNMYK